VEIDVINTASVPVSVTAHWHFFEANPRLRFDRLTVYGMRLAVAAGSALRFAPGVSITVGLVPIGGSRVVIGFAGLVDGPLDDPAVRAAALRRAAEFGYLTTVPGAGARRRVQESPVPRSDRSANPAFPRWFCVRRQGNARLTSAVSAAADITRTSHSRPPARPGEAAWLPGSIAARFPGAR
jgi:urease subunit gamma/beta